MSHSVCLLPVGIIFPVKANETVLDAAINNKIDFPYRCQVGACGACICKKVSGQVSYHLEPMLTEEEQQQGWIFPCQAYAKTNLVLTFEE